MKKTCNFIVYLGYALSLIFLNIINWTVGCGVIVKSEPIAYVICWTTLILGIFFLCTTFLSEGTDTACNRNVVIGIALGILFIYYAIDQLSEKSMQIETIVQTKQADGTWLTETFTHYTPAFCEVFLPTVFLVYGVLFFICNFRMIGLRIRKDHGFIFTFIAVILGFVGIALLFVTMEVAALPAFIRNRYLENIFYSVASVLLIVSYFKSLQYDGD